ncbi:MAG: S8 family serine peptidase [Kiritimatiellae bacterium]|nr:S8 family serine peptidase [Kiritimatiellia bacterium]
MSSAALRDMRNPSNPETVGEGNEQPTRYKGKFWAAGSADNGGVHINSGVHNFYYYLLCEGGSGTNDGLIYNLTGIGRTNAEQIAYRAITTYCISDLTYRDARLAWISAARDLNPEWEDIVAATWDAVAAFDIEVAPDADVTAVGTVGGPYRPHSFAYAIYNETSSNLEWTAETSVAWLSVAPMSGITEAMSGSIVTVAINNAATSLPKGRHTGSMHLRHAASGVSFAGRSVVLNVMPETVLEVPLEVNPGWPTTGQWEFGVPQGAGANGYGYPDPVFGATGTNVYGVNLAGDYSLATGGPYYVTAGPFDLDNYTNTSLVFSRWLNSDSAARVKATVDASTNGIDWITVWSNAQDAAITDKAWTESIISVGHVVDSSPISFFRWGYQVLSGTAHPYSGWNIDDLRLFGDQRDALRVSPWGLFRSEGYEEGPFSPQSGTWIVSNASPTSLEWSLSNTNGWITIEPIGGVLPSGKSTIVTATIASAIAGDLSEGNYYGSVVFSNITAGFSLSDTVTLDVWHRPGEISIHDSIAPHLDKDVPFGALVEGATRTETIIVSNSNPRHPLVISSISLTEPHASTQEVMQANAYSWQPHSLHAGTSSADSNDLEPFAVRWSHLDVEAHEPKILVYADDPIHMAPDTFVDQALRAMGLPYEAYYNGALTNFTEALTNQQWSLVIMAADIAYPAPETLDLLLTYLNQGGRLIAHARNVYAEHPIWAQMGIRQWAAKVFFPDDVFWWDTDHLLFNYPEEVRSFTNLDPMVYFICGHRVDAINDGIALAGASTTSAIRAASLVVANEGRSIFRGFFDGLNNADADEDGLLDGIELWKNMVHYSLSQNTFTLAGMPSLPYTVPPEGSFAFTVSFSPTMFPTQYSTVVIESDDLQSPSTVVSLSGSGQPEPLGVYPLTGLISIGHSGGPFFPETTEYVLSNESTNVVTWTATSAKGWISFQPEYGSLTPMATETVTAHIVTASVPLEDGVYGDTIIFSNTIAGTTYQRPVKITVITTPIIEVSPPRLDVTNLYGNTLSRTVVISNSFNADASLNVRIESRTTTLPDTDTHPQRASVAAPSKVNTVRPGADFVDGELLVRFAPRLSSFRQEQAITAFGGRMSRRQHALVKDLRLIRLRAGQTVEEALPLYNASSQILYAEPNYRLHLNANIPNDPEFDELWALRNIGQLGGTVGADIGATDAWMLNTGTSEVVVAIVDTGIDYNHEDLQANMWRNPLEIPGNGIDDDHNGFVDDVFGANIVAGTGDPMDKHDHGTHVAGTIGAAGNNGLGVVGVSWKTKLMAVKSLDLSSGTYEDAILGIEYAVENGAHIINASWAGSEASQSLRDAINAAGEAGVLFCAAAGNSAHDLAEFPEYPSSYHLANMIVVMSTDHNDKRSGFSNYGATSVDIAAPGSSILSTRKGGGYLKMSGTSMAAPHVAGAAALLLSVNAGLSPTDLRNILMTTADPVTPGLNISGDDSTLRRPLIR